MGYSIVYDITRASSDNTIWFGSRWELGQGGFHNPAGAIALRNGMIARAHYVYADGKDDPPRIVKLEIMQ